MSYFQVCRICLTVNVRMFTLKNSELHNFYEIFTSGVLSSEDGKPLTACFICHARLKRCSRLRQQAIKSNEILEQLMRGSSAVTQCLIQTLLKPYEVRDEFQVSPTYHVHLDPVQSDIGNDYKAELHRLDAVKNDLEIRDGHCETESSRNTVDYEIDTIEDVPTDSEDDLPLIAICSKSKVKSKSLNSIKKQRKKKEQDEKDFKVDAKEVELTEEEQKQELMERATSENYLNSPYKCEKCYKGFVDPQAFSNHTEKHDLSSGPHECRVCRLRYPSVRQLRAHSLAAHARRYACTRCPHRSHTRHQARDHEKWHNGHTYPCRICGQKFQKPTSFLTHMRKHHSEHVCVRCGDSFVGRHGLLMHLSKTHKRDELERENPDEPAAERLCRVCDIQFLTLNAWKRHILTSFKHTVRNENSAQCDVCGEQVTPLSRSSHMRTHIRELRPQPSPALTAAPTPAPTLQCGQCAGRFVTRSRLQAHVNRVHLGLKYNKNVVCEVCGKRCTSAAALRYHQRRHTGERPFACAQCPARFAERGRLRVHARTHSGERPYACAACHKRFSQKPALNRHYRVHSGARPYACAQCAKCFSQSNSLKLHVRTVHLKLPAGGGGGARRPPGLPDTGPIGRK